jgi:hypothetical protein
MFMAPDQFRKYLFRQLERQSYRARGIAWTAGNRPLPAPLQNAHPQARQAEIGRTSWLGYRGVATNRADRRGIRAVEASTERRPPIKAPLPAPIIRSTKIGSSLAEATEK